MQAITLQQIITLTLPLVAALVSYMLQQTRWSAKTNTTIASITVLLAATATLWLEGKLTGNVYADMLLVISAVTALQSSSFAPLQEYLKANIPVRSQPTMKVRPSISDWNRRFPENE